MPEADERSRKIAAIQTVLGGLKIDGIWGPKSQAALDAVLHPCVCAPVDAGRVDERSEANIATLHPRLQPIARDFIRKAAGLGITAKITSGTRTYAEQDALYNQGGVTKARGGYSNHNFGVAFDVTIFDSGKPVYESRRYKELGALGKSLGLSWGGDWKSFQDEPHFELRPLWAQELSERDMLSEFRSRAQAGAELFA